MLLSRAVLLLLVVALMTTSFASAAKSGAVTKDALDCTYSKYHPEVSQKSHYGVAAENQVTGKGELNHKVSGQFTKGLFKKIFGKKKKKKSKLDEGGSEDGDADDEDGDDGPYGSDEEGDGEGDGMGDGAGTDGEGEIQDPEYVESDTFGFDFAADLGFSVEDPKSMREYFKKKHNEKLNASDSEEYDYFDILDDVVNLSEDEYDEIKQAVTGQSDSDSDSDGKGSIMAMKKRTPKKQKFGKLDVSSAHVSEAANFAKYPKGASRSAQKVAAKGAKGKKVDRNARMSVPKNRRLQVVHYNDNDGHGSNDSDDEGLQSDVQTNPEEPRDSSDSETSPRTPEARKNVPSTVDVSHAPGLGPGSAEDRAKTDPVGHWRQNGTAANKTTHRFFDIESSAVKLNTGISLPLVCFVAMALL